MRTEKEKQIDKKNKHVEAAIVLDRPTSITQDACWLRLVISETWLSQLNSRSQNF